MNRRLLFIMKGFFKSLKSFFKWILVVVVGLSVILFLYGFLLGIIEGYEELSRTESNSVSLSYITEPCVELSNKFGLQTKLSDIQKIEFWKNYEGKAFEWTLELVEVSNDFLDDGFVVFFKCKNSSAFHHDITMVHPNTAKSMLLKMKKGSFYKVKGLLKDYNSISGLITAPL